MISQKQLDDFLSYLSPLAKKDGVFFDFLVEKSRISEITSKNQKLQKNSFSESQNFSLRLLKDQKTASSYSKGFSKKDIQKCYNQALESLHLCDNKEAGELSENQSYKKIDQSYNPDLSSTDVEEKIDNIKRLDKAGLSVSPLVKPTDSWLYDADRFQAFGNSLGQTGFFSESQVTAQIYCLGVKNDKRIDGVSSGYAKSYKDINFEQIGKTAALNSLSKLDYSTPKTGLYSLIFDSRQAVPSLIRNLIAHFNAKAIYDKESLLSIKHVGQQKFSPLLSIVDDPYVSWGSNSAPFDGEGYASQKTSLIENGIIKNYLSSSFYAKNLQIPHTANASRSQQGVITTSSSNLLMKKGEDSLEDFYKQQKETFIVIDGILSRGYNPISGDFSLQAEGFLYNQGKKQSICQFTFSGNIIDVFSNIKKVFNDSQKNDDHYIQSSSFLVPNLSVAGA